MLLFGGVAEEAAPLPSEAYGLITLGIGAPGSITWLITGGLDANPIAEPESFGMDAIIVEPDSVFAARVVAEPEYTGRALWADTRVPGEPTLWDKFKQLFKK